MLVQDCQFRDYVEACPLMRIVEISLMSIVEQGLAVFKLYVLPYIVVKFQVIGVLIPNSPEFEDDFSEPLLDIRGYQVELGQKLFIVSVLGRV